MIPVANGTEIIRACSNGQIQVNIQGIPYWLAHSEIRDLLVFGRRVPLFNKGGNIGGGAVAYPHPGGQGIVIAISTQAYLVPRSEFTLIVQGIMPVAPLTAIPWSG